jgi:pimeloyl-ACP methyl ester carboxylesterase
MQKQLLINGKIIAYSIYGKGKPVLLIHGFAEDNRIWQYQLDALSASYQLIIPDLPGSGSSQLIEDMSMEGMAASIREILIKEVSNPYLLSGAVIIGHSMGGYVTLAFAEKYPELTAGFGLFHSTAYEDSEEKKIARQRGIEFIRNHGSYEFLKQAIPNLFSDQFRITRAIEVSKQVEKYKYFSADSLVTYYEKMMQRVDRIELLKKTTKPVLFIAGELDKAVLPEQIFEQCHLPQLSYIHMLRHTAHMGMVEEVEKINNILTSFLDHVCVH